MNGESTFSNHFFHFSMVKKKKIQARNHRISAWLALSSFEKSIYFFGFGI